MSATRRYILRYTILLIAFIFCLSNINAQDIHFSQFNASPLNINPGYTGQFDGRIRLSGIQRTQWRSVTIPYSSIGFAVDMSTLELSPTEGTQKNVIPGIGIGLSYFHDKTGDSHFTTSVLNAAASYEFSIDEKNKLVPGLLLGFTNKRIDYSELYYDNQWNGQAYDPSIDPNETFSVERRTAFNLQFGVLYSRIENSRNKLEGGMGIFNLSNPKQSYMDDSFVRLDTRINLHGSYLFRIAEQWDVEPSFLFMTQGKFREFDIGGYFYRHLAGLSYEKKSVFGGLFFRTRDAGYIVAGLVYDAWKAAISYDINLSDLKPASNGRGGFEFSIIYIIPWKPFIGDYNKYCPDYM